MPRTRRIRHIRHTHRLRLVAAAAALAAVVSPLSACSLPGSSTDATSNGTQLTKVNFMLDWAPNTNHIGLYVAKNKGWYADAGLDVDILATSSAGADQAVDSGAADFAISTLAGPAETNTKGANNRMIMQIEQKNSDVWCSLASNTSITRPRDFDGHTEVTFGSSESEAVVQTMIRKDGGTGTYDQVTVGTSTFQSLAEGQGDFADFYYNWEGIEAELNGPALTCFSPADYDIPGNGGQMGVITSESKISSDPDTVRAFVQATQKGYEWAYENPDEASDILLQEAADSDLDEALVKASMKAIVDGQYWGDPTKLKDGSLKLGSIDTAAAQEWLDFMTENGVFVDGDGATVTTAPQAGDLTDASFLG
ncbi:MAG: ABC transporter substrate-binding protein [Pseudoscardovia radai]|nr:ABC transporter substrate-binding protein [Pseudoscardovia radai]